MIVTRNATDKDSSLERQLVVASKNSVVEISGERVWKKKNYNWDECLDLGLEELNLPKNNVLSWPDLVDG